MSLSRCVSFLALFSSTAFASTSRVAPEAVAAQYNLATSTTLPFPASTQSAADTNTLLVSQWSLSKGRIQDGPQNLAFVNDPFPSNPVSGSPAPSGPVLQVEYPEGSFSHDTGGAQFYTLWNTTDGSSFNTMMLTYELAFDSGFDWVKGGKLPGLRGGLNDTGCSGGNKADGLECWSSRLMWRKGGTGEVYAYIPMPNNLCSEKSITCNSDFGVSVSRGSFGFVSGQWMRVTQVIQLNNPPNVANGYIALYYNDILVLTQSDLQLRASSSIAANGLYFSTFFGGSDTSWATPVTTHTYFRNIKLWGNSAASNLTGALVQSNAPARQQSPWPLAVAFLTLAIGSAFCL